MTAQIIDGKALGLQVRAEIKLRTQALIERGTTPGLADILVGGDPASQVYVRNKMKACAEAEIRSTFEHLDSSISERQLLERINALNDDPAVHGILVQLPLPEHIDVKRVIEAIAPRKDVDGFHPINVGALVTGAPGFRPCTPLGCMKMLASIGLTDFAGKKAVVMGRSNIVGKPMALMLLAAHATVTVCHSKTPDAAQFTRMADIVVCAVGRPNTLVADMVKPGATIIDVGINRTREGKLCGDVDFEAVRQVAGFITPVPGGVGPMTIAMLLANTLEAAERAHTAGPSA
jgi:methylenetetrahydrofolate dehydrogenase (NADP+)/methenyltetrahydrofolate cyclohydrolase